MSSSPVSRREFLRGSGLVVGAAVGSGLGSALGPGVKSVFAAGLGSGVVRAGSQGSPMRVALVGTGVRGVNMWGRDVVRDYPAEVEFVGLCDINPGRLAFAKDYIGVACPTFTDFSQMLETTSPEHLIVTTMDSTHDEFIVAALERGCNVITEKPMTTDEVKCQAILDAQERTGRDITVTHNYRYAPHRRRMKELLMEGRIGRLTSVDFHWYLNTYHGASYFRRWHGKRRFSGTLFVHKACHHFDLLNWWIDSEPELVYAQGALEHYGSNNDFRHTNCRGCPHQARCEFYWDINTDPHLVDLYVKNEQYDGYLRDGCLWSEEIDIYDKMGAQIRYANGVQVSYSCTTYSPYEGYRIAFNGTEGRLEAWVHEQQPWPREDFDELRVTGNFGETELIRIPHGSGGHGGGDTRMQDFIFKNPNAPDQYHQRANERDGAMAVLIGIGARKSVESGEPVRIADLTTLVPRAKRT